MKARFIPVVLTAAVLMIGSDLSLAVDSKTDEPAAASSKPSKADKQKEIAARRKAVAKIKVVNINSATAEQLKKLPGIGDAEAAKIIAGRPYGSKAWLVTNNIISEGLYESLKTLIGAGPPFDPKKVKAPEANKK